MRFIINVVVSALVIALATALSRRYNLIAAILISLPLSSIIALSLIYIQTGDNARVASFSTSVFWLVLPSLIFFVTLPLLLRAGVNFWVSLGVSCATLAVGYPVYTWGLRALGIRI